MIWGGIIGSAFVAIQATAIPTKPRFVSNRIRRSLFDSLSVLMEKISALAFNLLGPAFIGYFLSVILVFIHAHITHQDSGQVGLAALFFIGPIGMMTGGAIGILRLLIKHRGK